MSNYWRGNANMQAAVRLCKTFFLKKGAREKVKVIPWVLQLSTTALEGVTAASTRTMAAMTGLLLSSMSW